MSETFFVTEADGLRDEASLIERGVVDSTGVLDLVAFLESAFGLQIEDDEILPENLDSIDKIAAFIARKGPSASARVD